MFSLVAALDEERGIGIGGELPWRIKKDMASFVERTRGDGNGAENAVLMGRKTWDSILSRFRPLSGRKNIVLSRAANNVDGAVVADSWQSALEAARSCRDVFVIGGSQIYQAAIEMDECDALYLTTVEGRYGCDVFFPEYEKNFERASLSEPHEEGDYRFRFETWRRLR